MLLTRPRHPPRRGRSLARSFERREGAQEVARALVAGRVLVEVELVVVLGVPPGPGGDDLGGDRVRPAPPAVPLLGSLARHLARHPLLLGRVVEDGAAVLRAGVGALAVRRRRVVHPVEELEELPVRRLRRIEDDLQGFRVCFVLFY